LLVPLQHLNVCVLVALVDFEVQPGVDFDEEQSYQPYEQHKHKQQTHHQRLFDAGATVKADILP